MATNIRSLLHKTYEDFSGGLNEFASSHMVADNEQIAMSNMTTRAGGGIKSRNGVEPYHVMTAGGELTTPVRNLFRYTRTDGTKKLLAYSGIFAGAGQGTDYVYADDNSGTFTSIARVRSGDGFCRFAQYRDCVFFGTENNAMRIYNSGETPAVIYPDFSGLGTASPFLGVSNDGGYLRSAYYVWRFTYDISSGDVFLGETEPIGVYNPTTKSFSYDEITYTDRVGTVKMLFYRDAKSDLASFVSAINIYRSPPLDALPTEGANARNHNLYYIGSVSATDFNNANVADIVFTDDGSIDYDGQQIRYGRLPYPPQARFLVHHKDRMWYGYCYYPEISSEPFPAADLLKPAPHRIFCSSFDGALPEPGVVHPLAWWDIDPTDGEGITGMISYKNKVLIVFKPNSMWAVMVENTGEKFPRVSIEAISQDIGCVAPESIAIVDGRVVWLSNQGVYYYDGTRPQSLKSEYINKTLREMPASAKYRAVGTSHSKEREYWLAHAHPDHADTHNKHIEKFNIDTASWSRDSYPHGVGAFIEKRDTDEPVVLLAGADDVGLITFGRGCGVYNMDVGASDKNKYLANDITWYFQTPFWDCGDPSVDKRFEAVAVHLDSGQDITMDVLIDDRLDTQEDDAGGFTIPAPSNPNELVWGISTWGGSTVWGGARAGTVVRSLDDRCWGKRISFRFSATTHKNPIEIQKITIYYSIKEGVRR